MTAAKMLTQARKSLGLTGRPNYITRDYANRHGADYLSAPWCDMSVTYWARKSDNADAVLPRGDRAYTVYHAEDGRDAGRGYSGTTANIKAHAKPGAIVFFDWAGTNSIVAIDHVGVVEVNLGDGRVQTIEGNTGDACKRRVRGSDVVAYFWNPDYEGEDMPSAKEIADAVYDRFTHTVTDDVWAAKEKILEPGQKIDPRTAFRQIWAYTKDGYARDREILARLAAQDATIKALAEALAAQNANLDVDALIDQIRTALDNVSINLEVGK
ncbi:CHAP domain-containing protein (plasmid) [Nonomuraea sp. CA-143628]|uniref:CHAP domain-containing protein n=1 Tax=Nonomuraea sp. CA-143628 TaxID=3239997 RepID=UPI003D913AFE